MSPTEAVQCEHCRFQTTAEESAVKDTQKGDGKKLATLAFKLVAGL